MAKIRLDGCLELVADRRRRQVIQHLRHEANGNIGIDDLVDKLDDDRTTDRTQLAIQLYHTHLPKLADHGVVEFDPENREVRYRPDPQTERILDSLPDELPLALP